TVTDGEIPEGGASAIGALQAVVGTPLVVAVQEELHQIAGDGMIADPHERDAEGEGADVHGSKRRSEVEVGREPGRGYPGEEAVALVVRELVELHEIDEVIEGQPRDGASGRDLEKGNRPRRSVGKPEVRGVDEERLVTAR